MRESWAHDQPANRCRHDRFRRWGSIAQRTVRPHRVVLPPPSLDQDLGFGERVKDLSVQQFIPQNLVAGLSAKDVSYASAINWSFGFTVVFPFAVFSLLSLVRRIPTGFRSMARAGMVVRQDWTVLDEDNAVAYWNAELTKNENYLRLVIFVVLVSAGEWVLQSALPLWKGALPQGFTEPDWSVAHVLGHAGMRLLNACFTAVAWTVQALAFSLLATYLVVVVTLIQFSELGKSGEYFRVYPGFPKTTV